MIHALAAAARSTRSAAFSRDRTKDWPGRPSRRPPAPPGDPVYQRLRKKLEDYSREKITRKDFLNGTAVYWDTEPKEPLVLPESADQDQGEFNEWLVLDFRLPNGKTAVQSFIEAKESSSRKRNWP